MTRPRVELADLPSMDAEIRRRSFAFNRRPGARNNRGRVPSSVATAATPLTIITSVPVRLWLRADLSVTIATGVSNWVDQSSNAYAFAQATGGAQPTRNAADATLNNQATITGDGTDDALVNAGTGTVGASYWRCSVLKVNTWTLNKWVMASALGSGCGLLLAGSSPNVYLGQNGTFVTNAGPTVGTWKRYAEQQSNATTDRLQIGSVVATGSALGRTAATNGLTLFAQAGSGGAYSAATFAEIIQTDGIPTPTEQTNIDTYLSTRYLASLLT